MSQLEHMGLIRRALVRLLGMRAPKIVSVDIEMSIPETLSRRLTS